MSAPRERIDPGRSMRLLWGVHEGAGRGPKQRLDLDDIIGTGMSLADEAGLDAVSMRRVADRLGVGAMTLYTYVQSKAELLDLMYDRVVGELQPRYPPGADWREKLESFARAEWDLAHRHRWLGELSGSRVALGPNTLDLHEAAVSVVSGLGLSGKEMNEVVTLLTSYVAGAARYAIGSANLVVEWGVTDTEWWEAVAPVLEEVWDPGRFPTLSSSVMEGAWDQPDDDGRWFLAEAMASFEFGLARVLDGIEAFIDRCRPRT